MKPSNSSHNLELSGFSDKSFINISKISSNQVTFIKNDDSTNSSLAIQALLGRGRQVPRLFGDQKQNMRPSNRSVSKRHSNSQAHKGALVKKVLIDLRGSEQPNSQSSSMQSTVQSQLSKKSSIMSSSTQLRLSSQPSNVKVYARMKPSNLDQTLQRNFILQTSDKYVRIDNSVYTFDEMFGQSATQQQLFESIAVPTVRDVFEGYNGTIFAYGQTGSGKTYTMFGCQQNKGIIPRAVEFIFNTVDTSISAKYKITASMLEIYRETLSDLFSLQKCDLKIKQSQEGIYVEGLTQLEVHNSKTLLGLVDFGQQIRKVSSTRVNQYSSRSHTILMIAIRSEEQGKMPRCGKLHLVDLAGSQKVRRSGASGQTLQQAKKINLSLSCLGNVINALTARKKKDHIPYRQSKLTRILQDSLSGNCKTSIIVNFSATQSCIEQSISAMKFAQRAKKITNNIKLNYGQKVGVDHLYQIINDLQKELHQTKEELERYKRVDDEQQSEAPTARLVIPSERANVEASLKNYRSRATFKPLKMSINLQQISSLSASSDFRINNTSLHSPSLSSLSINPSSSKDTSLNFSIKNDELSESYSVRLDLLDQQSVCYAFKK